MEDRREDLAPEESNRKSAEKLRETIEESEPNRQGSDSEHTSQSSKKREESGASERIFDISEEQKESAQQESVEQVEEHKKANEMQKRKKRESRKELLELLGRKNEKLMELDNEIKKIKQSLAEKEDRLLRLAAEFDNYRKRTLREWELHKKRANAGLLREILMGIDDLDRALGSMGDIDDEFKNGIKLVHSSLMEVLKRAGVSEIEALGTKFDPQYHEAFGEVEKADIEEGHVAEVIQKGYMLHDEVLRPARVIVSKKKNEGSSSL